MLGEIVELENENLKQIELFSRKISLGRIGGFTRKISKNRSGRKSENITWKSVHTISMI